MTSGALARRRGTVFFLCLLSLILLEIGLSVALPRATHAVRQRQEEQLRTVLGEYRRAIDKFAARWQRPPASLQELLCDEQGVPHLRRLYPDPTTGRPEWSLEVREGVARVHSINPAPSLSGRAYKDF